MGLWLKQSTAVTVKVGPFIDDTDGKTAETGLTITQAEVRLSKNGANIAQKNESTSLATDELGYYDCLLDTTDTNTLGVLQLFVHESGALPVFHEYMVVPTNVWDSFFGADKLDVNTAELANIDFGATMKTSLETAFDAGMDNAIPASNTAGSLNDYIKDHIDPVVDDLHTDVGTAITNIGDIHATDLPDLHTDVADIHTDVGTAITAIGDVHATDLPDLHTDVADLHTDIATVLTNVGDVHTDVGTAISYIDTEVAAIKAVTDTLTLTAIADAVLDEVTEGTTTLRHAIKLAMSMLASKSSGGGTATLVYQDIGDTKPRLTFTVDANGNRTAVTADAT